MQRFRVNEPNVVYEAFDEEIVLVNLETGNYYSVRGTGPAIWMELARGRGATEIVDTLQARYRGDPEPMAAAIADFARSLIDAELLVDAANGVAVAAPEPVAEVADKLPFEPPVIESYADMQDLLMLDPIHDVDTAGWPVANPA